MRKGLTQKLEEWLCLESNEMHTSLIAYRSIPLDKNELEEEFLK